MLVLASCGKKEPSTPSESELLEDVDLSFMGIHIGESVDSALSTLSSNENISFKSTNPSFSDDYIYPDFENIRKVQISYGMLKENNFDYGQLESIFYTNIATKSFGKHKDIPVKVSLYSKEGRVARIICCCDISVSTWTDFAEIYSDRYANSHAFRSYSDLLKEKDADLDHPHRCCYWGVFYKFKHGKRITLAEYKNDNSDFPIKGVWIVYEDATDYYDFLKFQKDKIKKAKDRKTKANQEKNLKIKARIENQDI